MAIICAYVIYRTTTNGDTCDEARKAQLEHGANRFIGAMMCLAGLIMATIAIFQGNIDKGNVIPGLVIAAMGMVANCIFWRRYTSLNRREPNSIVAVQARLYRAKTLVDTCVTVVLTVVMLLPNSPIGVAMDLVGSLVVSAYMIYCGITTFTER